MLLRNAGTGEEYLRHTPEGLSDVLTVVTRTPAGGWVTALPPAEAVAHRVEEVDGAQVATIALPHLVGPEAPVSVRATITIRLPADGGESLWSLQLENAGDYVVHEVLFPRIAGVAIGDDPAAGELVFPYHAGERTRNPIHEYAGPEFLMDARNGVSLQTLPTTGHRGRREVYVRECNYLGSASMQWLDYSRVTQGDGAAAAAEGLYVASYDETATVTGVRVETGGPDDPWMGFGFRKHVAIRPGETWRSRPYAVAVHRGDWHWAADRYRAWATSVMRFPEPPRWFKDDPVVNPHYDFKSQAGKVTHRFSDVPAVYARAREHGFNHQLFAGWNRLGFDGAYAEYFPDLELGTQVELRDACREVVSRGGKVTFYINCRIFNVASDYRQSIVEPAACRDRDGQLYQESYGTQTFAVMCPSTTTWRRIAGDFAHWMVEVYGATGVYLDQIGSAPSLPCYAEGHGHDSPGTFNQGYLRLLADVYRSVKGHAPETFVMIENCGDAYGQYVDAHLTWMPAADAGRRDRHWAVFKYAFPECIQVNMVTAEPEVLYRAILIGSAFWVRAEADPLPEALRAAIAFRRAINPVVADGRFRDTAGLTFDPVAVEATHFVRESDANHRRTVLVLVWNKSERAQEVGVDRQDPAPGSVRRLLMGGGWEPDVGWQRAGGGVRLAAPPATFCAFELST